MDYDKTIKRLDEISKKLEDGKTSLDESIKLYEESVLLTKQAYKEISEAQGKVLVLKSDFDKFSEIKFEDKN